MKVMVTGANGFIGAAVVRHLAANSNFQVIATARRPMHALEGLVPCVLVPTLTKNTDWRAVLSGVDAVVHTAGRVHIMKETASDPLAAFREINVAGTMALAQQAAEAGVKRFIYLSSIKVNGESTQPGQPFTAHMPPNPADTYAVSKLEAEQGLQELSQKTGMELVIIRPPLVYGPSVKANFLTMMFLLHRGFPLPLGSIHNQRSFVALDNLVDLVKTCVIHPSVAQQILLVSDGEDLSTTQLLRRMGKAMRTPVRLLPVPSAVLWIGATLIGRRDIAQRLCNSLQVDMTKTQALLGWEPPIGVDEGLKRATRVLCQ
jgi:nucleoside-diphosphate-sugar epimerase